MFITHDTKNKGAAAAVEEEQDLDEESGEFQDAETKAKELDNSMRQTQSMPLIVDSADSAVDGGSDKDRGIPSVSKSVEYKRVMEEVKGQREQLLAFHNRQREEELLAQEELEQAKREGEEGGEEDGSTVEELQPMEGNLSLSLSIPPSHACTHTHTMRNLVYL